LLISTSAHFPHKSFPHYISNTIRFWKCGKYIVQIIWRTLTKQIKVIFRVKGDFITYSTVSTPNS
jgi:hypothetical protein